MKTVLLATVGSAALLLAADTACAGLFDALNRFTKNTNATAIAGTALTQDQMVGGLKEALAKGVERAVSQLGRDGGFLTNLNVKIPMPEKLRTAEKTLRALGQDKMADDFIGSMNHAAEKAVPQAASVFAGAIKQMSVEDARTILAGPNDAATQFFKRTTQTNLFGKFLPLVQQATDQVGVTSLYKQMMGRVSGAGSLGGLFGGRAPSSPSAADIDAYVTNKALDGLFKMVAEEEKSIRENPLARTSDLLQKVFGSASR